jgi:hypothetical protein
MREGTETRVTRVSGVDSLLLQSEPKLVEMAKLVFFVYLLEGEARSVRGWRKCKEERE